MLSKTCPKCQEDKALEHFYRVKSRKDGYASWCKECSNKNRKLHKKPAVKAEYKFVASRSKDKPTCCPTCKTDNVPSNRMRGRIEGKELVWECISCRNDDLSQRKQVTCYCDWCCESFTVPPSSENKRFCDADCLSAWRKAVRVRNNRKAPVEEISSPDTTKAIPSEFKRVRVFRVTNPAKVAA